MMKRRLPFLVPAITLALALAACNTPIEIKTPMDIGTPVPVATDSPAPSPSPLSAYSFPPKVYQPGYRPLSQVSNGDVTSVQIGISRDSQPEEWPDPVKTITGAEDIRSLVDALQSVEIIRQVRRDDPFFYDTFPVGANGFNICFFQNDGSVVSFYLYGDVYLGMDSIGYAVNKLTESMDTLYNAMDYEEALLSEEKEHDSSNLFEIDGWRYFAADGEGDNQGKVGHLRGNKSGEEDHVIDLLSLEPVCAWTDGRRIVFVGYQSPTKQQKDPPVLISALPDGGDRKVLQTVNGVFQDPCWDDDMLYYVGWSQDDAYPKPLLQANADFSDHVKVMDIPGPLVTVRGGSVYCLSGDRKSLLRLPEDEAIKTFEQPIESLVYVSAFMHYELIGKDGKHFFWKP